MLDFYFDSKVRMRQLRLGPLTEHLDGLAGELQRQSFSRNRARTVLSIAGQFNRYAGIIGVAAKDVDEALVDKFLAEASLDAAPAAMRHLLRYLRKQGIIAPASEPALHPFASTLESFDRYLRDVRGLEPSTRRGHLSGACALLDWLRERYGSEAPQRIAGPDVLAFITERLRRFQSRSSRSHVCSKVRVFLRYLHASGTIVVDLARVVPRVATPRLASLPQAFPWKQVRALIDGVDTSHPDGMRDKAILLLLATLGLRSKEVRSLTVSNIAWRAGEIRLPRTKTRRERVLPLLHEVGSALADYVLHGRPVLAVPQVFLRHGPRPGPLASSNSIVWIVRRHLRRAGIHVARGGAHLLRHSLATRMVNAGVPIKSIADVLGHVSIDTTAIYTKVDVKTLAAVALPFPGGAR